MSAKCVVLKASVQNIVPYHYFKWCTISFVLIYHNPRLHGALTVWSMYINLDIRALFPITDHITVERIVYNTFHKRPIWSGLQLLLFAKVLWIWISVKYSTQFLTIETFFLSTEIRNVILRWFLVLKSNLRAFRFVFN